MRSPIIWAASPAAWPTRCGAGANSRRTSCRCRIRARATGTGSRPTPGSRPSWCPRSAGACTRCCSSAVALQAVHVVVRQAEMVADLVDQHVTHHRGEVLAGLAPIIEQRPAIEKDHVDMGPRIADRFVQQIDAAIEAEQVERALELHVA